ncbi:MAG: roadblock/LC7 domain-containing protein [Acidobacteriota bacterium]
MSAKRLDQLPNFVLREDENEKILFVLSSIQSKCKAETVALINRNGQEIATHGQVEGLDVQSLASLAAGTVAATHGLARTIGEKEFQIIFHEGEARSIHITAVGSEAILVLLIAKKDNRAIDPTSLKRASMILQDILKKTVGTP